MTAAAVPLHARDLLTRDLATVTEEAPVARALALMQHLAVHHLPVLSPTGLVGLVHADELPDLDDDALVGPLVHRDVPRAHLQDGVAQLALLIASSPCRAVLVVDRDGRLLGVLTDDDLRRTVVLPD